MHIYADMMPRSEPFVEESPIMMWEVPREPGSTDRVRTVEL